MRFAAEGYPLLFGSVIVCALVFAAALRFRSWPVWLAGLACTGLTVVIAWQFRLPLPPA